MLRRRRERALANGVEDVRWLSGDEATALEPEVRCLAALLSPSTGIFDSHGYMLSLKGEAEAHGAAFAFRAAVVGGAAAGRRHLYARRRWLANDARGIWPALPDRGQLRRPGRAGGVARSIRGLPADTVPPLHYSKGCYFSLAGRPPFERLVYPPPDHASIGLHYTRDLAGRGRFGPDAQWVEGDRLRSSTAHRAELFYASIRRYWPGLPDDALPRTMPASARRSRRRGAAVDFVIQGPETHGMPGLINLFGIESPGLTASLAIAEEVAERLNGERLIQPDR